MVTDLPTDQLKIWQEGNWEAKRYEYDLKHTDTVIDLGAYQGEFAQKIHDMYGCEVIAVEPTYAILGMGSKPWLTVINKAAWICEGSRIFYGNAYWTSTNIEHDGNPQLYECFDVNTILNREIALLKMNVEGDEYFILKHIFESGLYKNVRNFQIQFHQVKNYIPDFIGINNYLSKSYHRTWNVDWIWCNWQRND
jgi:hypothetical protein